MTKEERHTAHLRKKRQQKTAKRVEENRLEVMAKWDPKVKAKLDKRKVIETLSGNKQVTIVKTETKKGKKWKHNLSDVLMKK